MEFTIGRVGMSFKTLKYSARNTKVLKNAGQSIHAFDFALAPYVKMSFAEHFKESYSTITGKDVVDIYDFLVDDESDYEWVHLSKIKSNEFNDIVDLACQSAMNKTIDETKQAMKGLIHDLNIMNSRSRFCSAS